MELVIPVVAILIGLGLRVPADLSLTPEAGARAPPDIALPGRALAVLFSLEMPGKERTGLVGRSGTQKSHIEGVMCSYSQEIQGVTSVLVNSRTRSTLA